MPRTTIAATRRLAGPLVLLAALVAGARGQASPGASWPRSLFRSDPGAVLEVRRRAETRGHALLVLLLPAGRRERLARIQLLSACLRLAEDATLAELAACEVVGATWAAARRALPADSLTADPSAAAWLLEPGGRALTVLPADALELDPLVELQARPELEPDTLRRLELARALAAFVLPGTERIELRARAERGPISPGDLHRLTSARGARRAPPLDLVRRHPARVRLVAEQLGQHGASWVAALARAARGEGLPRLRCGLEIHLPRGARDPWR